jgi:hypothetical protein
MRLINGFVPVHGLLGKMIQRSAAPSMRKYREGTYEDARNRKPWHKLHLVVDVQKEQILSAKLTSHDARDSAPVPALLHSTNCPLATAMSRFKNEFSDGLRSRTLRTQATETQIVGSIMNTMTGIGVPDGH